MHTEPFAPVLIVNRVFNAIVRNCVRDRSIYFDRGMLVRAIKWTNLSDRWDISCPPYLASVVVDGQDLMPITSAE